MCAKIGLVQVKQELCDGYAERTQKLLDLARACFEEGADLVFFPEAYQYVSDREIIYRHEDLRKCNREWKSRCAALAREYHAYIVPWDYELTEDGKVYNASYILDRNGEEVGRYRKVHLTHGEQKKGITNGTDFPVFELDFGKVGIMICFDNYFPESARILGNRGAQLVLYPLYGDTLNPGWELKTRVRALDNSMYVAPCRIDTRPSVFTGLVSPDGRVLCRLDAFPSYTVVDVDMGREVVTQTTGMSEYRENIRQYLDRCHRPDAYTGLSEMPTVYDWNTIFFEKEPPVMTREEYEKK